MCILGMHRLFWRVVYYFSCFFSPFFCLIREPQNEIILRNVTLIRDVSMIVYVIRRTVEKSQLCFCMDIEKETIK